MSINRVSNPLLPTCRPPPTDFAATSKAATPESTLGFEEEQKSFAHSAFEAIEDTFEASVETMENFIETSSRIMPETPFAFFFEVFRVRGTIVRKILAQSMLVVATAFVVKFGVSHMCENALNARDCDLTYPPTAHAIVGSVLGRDVQPALIGRKGLTTIP